MRKPGLAGSRIAGCFLAGTEAELHLVGVKDGLQ